MGWQENHGCFTGFTAGRIFESFPMIWRGGVNVTELRVRCVAWLNPGPKAASVFTFLRASGAVLRCPAY
jgi:hypothetical protein